MLLKEFEIRQINYWCAYTMSIDDRIYDIIVINYTNMKLNLQFKYERFKSLCYYELFLDYGETYTSNLEYTELKRQLIKLIPYLELSKDIEEFEL